MYRRTYIGTKFVSICSLLSQKITANYIEKEMKKNIKNAEVNLVLGLDCVFTGWTMLRVFGRVSLDHVII